MKNIIRYYLVLFLSIITLNSCNEFTEDFTIEGNEIDPFVYIFGTQAVRNSAEGASITIQVIPSYAIPEDITVTYSLSGEIKDGGEFEVVNGTEGTVTIIFDEDNNALDRGNIEFFFPTDGEPDGDKSLFVELTSAVTASGRELGIGKGAGNLLTRVEIIVFDIDCPSDLAGNYTAGNSCYDSDASAPVLTATESNGVYLISDFTGGFYAFASAPNIPATIIDQCGNLSIEDFVFSGVLEFTNMSGKVNEDGSLTLTWTEATGFGEGGNPVTCTTTIIPVE